MNNPVVTMIQCNKCGTPFPIVVIIGGEEQGVTCPGCGATDTMTSEWVKK